MMKQGSKSLSRYFYNGVFFLLTLAVSFGAQADSHQEQAGGRAMGITVEAEVTEIDLDAREVSLEGPMGNTLVLTAHDEAITLKDIRVGDMVIATYLAALEAELRAPTEEELSEPWVVLEEGGMSEGSAQPGLGGARLIRAVCTIEGMNRLLGTVVIKDSRGKAHLIDHVEPKKMEGVTLGQTVVVLYTEAIAMTLEKKAGAAE